MGGVRNEHREWNRKATSQSAEEEEKIWNNEAITGTKCRRQSGTRKRISFGRQASRQAEAVMVTEEDEVEGGRRGKVWVRNIVPWNWDLLFGSAFEFSGDKGDRKGIQEWVRRKKRRVGGGRESKTRRI